MLSIISFLIIIPPLLWSTATIADTHLLKGHDVDSTPGAILTVSGVFTLFLAFFLMATNVIFFHEPFLFTNAGYIILNGILVVASMWLYLEALKREEAHLVLPWFQLIPIFGVIGGVIFLQEIPQTTHIVAIFLLVMGGISLSFKDGKIKKHLFVTMMLSAFLLSTSDLIFAYFGRESNNSSALFWDVLGKSIWFFAILMIPKYRHGYRKRIQHKFGLQMTGETLTILADILFDWSKLRVPVAIAQATACSTPLVGFGVIALCSKFFPKIIHEKIKEQLWQKIMGIGFVVVGSVMLALF